MYQEEGDGAATTIQSAFRGKKGRVLVDQRQTDVEERREDLRLKEEELDRRKTVRFLASTPSRAIFACEILFD